MMRTLKACTGVCTPHGCSCPIVLDVFNVGIHLTSLHGGVSFDFNGNGKPLFMAWTDPKYRNAWLALGRNHNGRIDSVQELFGYPTEPQVPGADRNGWQALAVYDEPAYGGNADGVTDAADAIYQDLLLWIDKNHDGISEADELHHLVELGVTDIELTYRDDKSYADRYGNEFKFESFVDVEPVGGGRLHSKRQAWDVVLRAIDELVDVPRTHFGASFTLNPLCVPR
jgi:hypothetical protein